jgi:hypothetical protein
VFSSKYRIHALLILVALLIIFIPKFNERPPGEKAQAASAAATGFLQRVDADEFAESWQISAPLLRERVTRDAWVEQLRKTRAVAGAPVERTLTEMSYSTTAKDSPEGEYILIRYDTAFQGRPNAKETLTVMLCEDQVWRVAGYFIQ